MNHTLESIIALYNAKADAAGQPIRPHVCEWRATISRAIVERDAPALKVLANGVNPTGLAVFCEVAGIKAPRTQRDQWAAIKAFCGYSEEQDAARVEARKAELAQAAVTREVEWSARAAERVSINMGSGVTMTGREWVDSAIADGWTRLSSWKRGAATAYGLARPGESTVRCMDGKGWGPIARYARAVLASEPPQQVAKAA
jgi:hypothetical protein